MKKYLSIFSTSFKQEKDAIWDTISRCVIYFLIVYILIQLWSYIYGDNGPNSLINGYSLCQMVWYLIITESIVNSARSSMIARSVSNEIKTGSIAYKLNKPYNFYLYNVFSFMGKSCFVMFFTLPVAILIGIIFVGLPETFVWFQIFPCLLCFILSIFLTWCLYGLLGLVAFWVQDATPFVWILQKFLMILGMFFPLEFFPSWLQPIIKFSPIYSIMSGPSSLVANFSWELFGQVVLSQVAWCVIIILLGLGLFSLGKRKVTSNGG